MRRDLGTIRETSPGTWVVQASLGRDPVSGKRRRPTRTVRGSRREAERALARIYAEAGAVDGAAITLREYLDSMYLPHLRERVKSGELRIRTVDGYAEKLDAYVVPVLGSKKLTGLRPYDLDRWLAGLSDKGLSPRTRLHAYRVLSTALVTAVRWRLMPSNPLAAVTAPSVKRTAPVVLSASQANDYLDAFKGHELEPIVAIALGIGLRRSELCALEWSDIDMKTGTVSITKGRHERGCKVWTEPPKSENSRRIVVLPKWALETIRPYVGLGPIVGALTPDQVSTRYRKHVTDSGLPWCPLKNLRHSYATIALASGVDLAVVSRILGHSTIAITDGFYLAPGLEAYVKAAEKMGELRHIDEAREA